MFDIYNNPRVNTLQSALKAAEDLTTITATNIANTNTLGYKALRGRVEPTYPEGSFPSLLAKRDPNLLATDGVRLEITEDDSPGKKVKIGDKVYEGSNVDPTEEFRRLINASQMTRSAISALQLENRNQQELLNLGRQ